MGLNPFYSFISPISPTTYVRIGSQEFNEELKRGREEGNDESAPKAISADNEDKEEKKAE